MKLHKENDWTFYENLYSMTWTLSNGEPYKDMRHRSVNITPESRDIYMVALTDGYDFIKVKYVKTLVEAKQLGESWILNN